jgi:microcompartment protein CcmK/EutM
MLLGRVIGSVTSTIKHPEYAGHKLMLVQPIDAAGNNAGTSVIAVDRVQAGPGDRVIVLQEGSGVRQILERGQIPIRLLIVGIVDEVDVTA